MGTLSFIVDTSNCEASCTDDVVVAVNELLGQHGFSCEYSTVSDSGLSGAIVFKKIDVPVQAVEPAVDPAPQVAPVELPPEEIVINLGTAPEDGVDPNQQTVPAPDVVAALEPVDIPAETSVHPRTQSGIVFIKSLLPSEPVPFSCDFEKDVSELRAHSVAYGKDLVTFNYRNTTFKFPVEQDNPDAESILIRVVFALNNQEQTNSTFLKVVDSPDDNCVVFGKSDIDRLGLVEQLSTQD